MPNGRVIVPAPPFTPLGSGLLAVANDMTAQFDPHWEAGVIWQPLCAYPGSTYDECLAVTGSGSTPQPPQKEATTENVRRAATPFTVYVRKDCSAPGFWNRAPGEVDEGLTEAEAWQVERTFWTGLAGGQRVAYPHLAADADLFDDDDQLQLEADEVTDAPVNVIEGLGLLEQGLADCYQGQGVIHVPSGLASHLTAWGLMTRVGNRYITSAGNLVAVGHGYPGTAPDGSSTDDVLWMYATGAVFYARSVLRSFTPTESFDRSDNTLEQMAERTYVVGWDCCLLAAEIDITLTISGAA